MGRTRLDNGVNQAEQPGLIGAHEAVALHARGDLVDALTGDVGVDVVEPVSQLQYFICVNRDVAGLPAGAAAGLVQHDARVGQRLAMAALARRQQQRRHAARLPHAHCVHRRRHVVHRVVDRHPRRHHAARRVNVQRYRPLRRLRLQEQQLRDYQRRHRVRHWPVQHHDVFL